MATGMPLSGASCHRDEEAVVARERRARWSSFCRTSSRILYRELYIRMHRLTAWRQHPRSDLFIVLAWALVLRLIFAALTADTYDPDEFVVLVLSRDFTHGAVPYRDFMFFHPPGVLVLFRLLQPLTSWWWPSGRLVMILVDVATTGLVWRIGQLLYGRREALAAGLLYAVSPLALVCSVRIQQDTIITCLGVAGLMFLLSIRSYRGAVLAGICLGLAVWVKYPAILFLPVYLLAAWRRALISVASAITVAVFAFFPFVTETHYFLSDTVSWQLVHRPATPPIQRIGAVVGYLLLVNPLTLPAFLRGRKPLWLIGGFAIGGVFLFASQAYYHYFVPMVPFAALIAAPLVGRYIPRMWKATASGALALTLLWGADIAFGSAPTKLFIPDATLSSIRPAVHVLNASARGNEPVLTDEFQYAFLAKRAVLNDYFWNVSKTVSAKYLEKHLDGVAAVVLTRNVAPTYPPGFTAYLKQKGYYRIQTKSAEVWLIPHLDLAQDRLSAWPPCTRSARRRLITCVPGYHVDSLLAAWRSEGLLTSVGGQ